jgi:hypothetical protein
MSHAGKVGDVQSEVRRDEVVLTWYGECTECGCPAEVRVTMRVGAFREFARLTLDAIKQRP